MRTDGYYFTPRYLEDHCETKGSDPAFVMRDATAAIFAMICGIDSRKGLGKYRTVLCSSLVISFVQWFSNGRHDVERSSR